MSYTFGITIDEFQLLKRLCNQSAETDKAERAAYREATKDANLLTDEVDPEQYRFFAMSTWRAYFEAVLWQVADEHGEPREVLDGLSTAEKLASHRRRLLGPLKTFLGHDATVDDAIEYLGNEINDGIRDAIATDIQRLKKPVPRPKRPVGL